MNTDSQFSVKKIISLYGADIAVETLAKAESSGLIPSAQRAGKGSVKRRVWDKASLPLIGERYGFLKKFSRPIAMSIFITKGGVLKTSITLNMARMAALHNIRTLVVGLDMQGDITSALGFDTGIDDAEDLNSALAQLNSIQGLNDFYTGRSTLEEIILPTDLPTLFFIPETPELVQLDQSINQINRREYWLREKVIEPLKDKFDLIIMDCSPNWNRLITNSLVASDIVISPLECKINNFRNLSMFRSFIEQFKRDVQVDFRHLFVPTRFLSTRRLSTEIRSWYMKNVPGCTNYAIREGVPMEEATASHLSLPEYLPNSTNAAEIREVLDEIWGLIREGLEVKNVKTQTSARLSHDGLEIGL